MGNAIHGKSGTVAFSGQTFLVTSWTLNTTVDMAESTSTADVGDGYKVYLAGWKDWTASCECNYDSGGIALSTLGAEATLTLDTVNGEDYSGTAFCTGHSVSDDMGDVIKITWSFQGSGELSESTDVA